MSASSELFAVLLAGLREGDLPGHLRVWRQVMKGEVLPKHRTMVFIPQGIKDNRSAAAYALQMLRAAADELRAAELSDRPLPDDIDAYLAALNITIRGLAKLWHARGATITDQITGKPL